MAGERDDETATRLREAIDGGRALYRRGAFAIARTAGDQGALLLLAGGVAVAGLSWLAMRRRAAKRGA